MGESDAHDGQLAITPPLDAAVRAALPTFFVVGAPKAGTTSLHEYLAVHPEIAMSSVKEPMCFEPRDWVARLAGYRELFTEPAAVRGESSTAYASFPWAPEVPDRILATVPEARIVYLVRDPIPRTLSHYAQNLWDRKRVRGFDELMDDLEHPMNMPVWCSRYATQLSRWTERLSTDRVLVLDQRDLRRDRNGTLRRVFAFLGVDPDFTDPSWDAEHNTADDHRMPSRIAYRLGERGVTAARAGRLPRLLTRPVPKPQLRPDQRERLVALLRPEAERFSAMTGLPIDHWDL